MLRAALLLAIWNSIGIAVFAAQEGIRKERSLSQYGITWTFSRPASVGQFVTGDWWVVGPVTVESVMPAPTADRHGSAVNPPAGDKQGYYGPGYRGQKALWTISPGNPNARHEEVAADRWETFGDQRSNNGMKAEAYRKLNGPTWVGEALAARLTGMVDGWNHPAFFDYVDRWWEEEHQANPFVTSMWKRYREQADEIGASRVFPSMR